MIIFGTEAQGRLHRRSVLMPDGIATFKAEWMESGKDPRSSPTVFLVEQPPNYSVATHFHRHNEYQVIVRGSGMLGPHELRPVTLHYAGAYTGYGPLVSGERGLFYFTLRPAFDPGPLYVVEHRDQMLRGPKRQLHSARFPPSAAPELQHSSALEKIEIFARDESGGLATLFRLPPYASAHASPPSGSAGQFFMIIAGSMIHDRVVLRRWETLFVSEDEPALQMIAGGHGAEVLLLQVPPMAEEYRAPATAESRSPQTFQAGTAARDTPFTR